MQDYLVSSCSVRMVITALCNKAQIMVYLHTTFSLSPLLILVILNLTWTNLQADAAKKISNYASLF
jgi:hypothetical protein